MTRRVAPPSDGIHRSILVRAPLDDVFAAFSDTEKLAEWYYDGVTVDLRVGGFLAFEGIEGEVRATIEIMEPPARLVMRYHAPWWGRVEWTFASTRTGTRVKLAHTGFEGREDWTQRFVWGWESTLKSLKAVCEGRPVK